LNVFIIGNGFDRAHNLPTSYMDFRDYLECENWSYLTNLEEPYDCVPESKRDLVENHLWREFENNLSEINDSEIIDASMSLDMGLESGDIGIEDTLNEYWEEKYGYIQRLNDYIKSWAEQIDINVPKKTNRIKRNSVDLFISFNYTLLLEKLYKIDRYQILHIHGSIDSDDLPPVIGHGNFRKIQDAKEQAHEAENNFWEKDSSIYNALANYYERTLKDVPFYLSIHSTFFKRLKLVNQVFVVGHSFGEVDLPYFKKISDSIQENAVWNIYYYNEDEAVVFKDKISSIGVRPEQVKMRSSHEFFNRI
jgi:hypothetical protein